MELEKILARDDVPPDIKELLRQKAEEERVLQERNEQLESLVNNSFEGIATHDNGTIKEVNDTFCEMFGYSRKEVIGMNVLDLGSPETRDVVVEKIKEVAMPLCQAENFELVNLEYTIGDRENMVRLFLDKPGGITLDDCIYVSRQLGDLIDVHIENIAETIEAMYSLSKFQDKFKPSPKLYRKKNITTSFSLKKNVITRESLEYLCIYNKYNELFDANKNENMAFLQSLSEDHLEGLKSYYAGVIRVESKYASKARIRVCFGLGKEHNLYDLLTSKRNVNEDILNRIYDDKRLTGINNTAISYNKFDKLNTLKQYDNNLEKIFEMQRAMGSEIQKSKMLKPYKELMHKMAIESENEKIITVMKFKKMIRW